MRRSDPARPDDPDRRGRPLRGAAFSFVGDALAGNIRVSFNKGDHTMSTPVEKLAIMLQRAKTQMELYSTGIVQGLPDREITSVYRNLCGAIDTLENIAGVDAQALRDAEDAATPHLDGSWAEPRPELPGTPLCQCNDPGCPPHCGDRCNLLPVCHLVRIDTDVLPSKQVKVKMCEFCGENALETRSFAVDHTVGSEE